MTEALISEIIQTDSLPVFLGCAFVCDRMHSAGIFCLIQGTMGLLKAAETSVTRVKFLKGYLPRCILSLTVSDREKIHGAGGWKMSNKKKKKEDAVMRRMPFHVPILFCGILITVVLAGIYLCRTEYIMRQNAKHLAKLYAERFETVAGDAADRTDVMKAAVQSSKGKMTEGEFHQLMLLTGMGRGIIAEILVRESGEIYQYPENMLPQLLRRDSVKAEMEELKNQAAQKKEAILGTPLDINDSTAVCILVSPVFTLEKQEEKPWGFACVAMDIDKISEAAGWEDLKKKGYSYELTPERGSSAVSEGEVNQKQAVQQSVRVPGGQWSLSVSLDKGWTDWTGCMIIVLLGTAASAALSYIYHVSQERKHILNTMELEQEIFRISMEESGLTIFLYNQEDRRLVFQNSSQNGSRRGKVLEHIPESMAEKIRDLNMRKEFLDMFKAMEERKRSAFCVMKKQTEKGMVWERVTLVNPYPDKYGNRKMIGIIQDITAEKKIELDDEILRISADYSGLSVFIYNKETQELTFKNKGGWNIEFPANMRPDLKNTAERFISPESREEFLHAFEEISATGRKTVCMAAVSSGGEERWKKITLLNPFSVQGGARQIVGVMEDVTEERKKEHQLLKEKAYMEAMIGQSVFHLETNVTRNRLLSYNRIPVPEGENIQYEEFIREHVAQIVYQEDAREVSDILSCSRLKEEFYSKGKNQFTLEYRRRTSHGYSWCVANVYLTEIPESHELNAVVVSHNNEEKKKKELELLYKAERDQLTGLYNRAACERYINASLSIGARDMKSAFLLIDLDNFKEINDTMGHVQGDLVLKEVAGILKCSFRKTDIVGRLGGDEFIVLMRDIKSKENVCSSAEKLLGLLKRTYKKEGQEVSISGSIGIAMVPECGRKFKELYDCADRALYTVKYAEKNDYCFAERKECQQTEDRK